MVYLSSSVYCPLTLATLNSVSLYLRGVDTGEILLLPREGTEERGL